MFPPRPTKWLQWSNAPGDPKAIVFDADSNQADITMMNEELTFAGVEAEREAWVAKQGTNQGIAETVTKIFQFQPMEVG